LAQAQPLAIDGLQNVEIPPSARAALDLGRYVTRPDLTVIAATTLPAVVERSFAVNGGLSFAAGMPLSGTTSVPARVAPTTSTTTAPAPN
jgi:hypothetical protein